MAITGIKVDNGKDRIGLEVSIPNFKKAIIIVATREGKTLTDYIVDLLKKDVKIQKEIKSLDNGKEN